MIESVMRESNERESSEWRVIGGCEKVRDGESEEERLKERNLRVISKREDERWWVDCCCRIV